jgi:uncharacterized protein (TIRG00374 family)
MKIKNWQFWLGVLISVVCLWLALRGLHLDQFWGTVQSANYWWLIPGVGVYFIGVWVRAWRWHYLLGPIKKIPTKTMFPITTIGYMGNNIYPARAGEVLRAVILKRKEGVPVSASLATIIVERIFDGVVMLAFVFVNLPELAKLTGSSGFVGNIQQVAVIGTGVFLAAGGNVPAGDRENRDMGNRAIHAPASARENHGDHAQISRWARFASFPL